MARITTNINLLKYYVATIAESVILVSINMSDIKCQKFAVNSGGVFWERTELGVDQTASSKQFFVLRTGRPVRTELHVNKQG